MFFLKKKKISSHITELHFLPKDLILNGGTILKTHIITDT